ncbi:MAG: hypothetical protein FWF46_05560 [Oscillospiraceae bacterium]|nr:hypothetical protein [Oscillospiraceae bacterium]
MERSKALTAKVLIVIIVILVIAVVGLLAYIIFANNKNNSTKNDTSNEGGTVNIADVGNNTTVNNDNQTNTNTTDPYANYPNFAWVRTTSIDEGGYNSYSAYIDNSGIIHITYDDWGTSSKQEITISSLSEKAKYICAQNIPFQSFGDDLLLVLTESNNLYIIDNLYASDGNGGAILNNTPNIQKVSSDILEIYQDKTYTGRNLGGYMFLGIYALTGDGKLLSINEPNVLGLSYEECTPYKIIDEGDYPMQITRDNYLRDDSNIQINYVLDNNKNKITVQYSFAFQGNNYEYSLDGNCDYIITQDNKIYKVDHYNGINDYKIDLLNNKTVNDINYDNNNKVITVTYTDNTTDKFNVGQNFDASTNKYGF